VDISHVKNRSFGGSQYWLLAVDDATDFSFSLFLKTKDQTARAMISLIKELRALENVVVKKIRCDNSGENVAFQAAAKEEGLGLHFEFTARQTPQQNGRVERKFATLFGRVRSMLNSAGLTGKHEDLRQGLWAECAETATKMENLAAKVDKDPPFRQFYKRDPVFLNSLRVFGEIAVVNDAQKLRSKLANRGEHCMFVGYANDHAGDTFKLLNLKTRRIWKSRDVKWIASTIVTLQEPKPKPPSAKDDDEDENIHAWAQAHGVNVIPDDDEDANAAAPPADADDEDVAVPPDEDEDDDNTAPVKEKPVTNKTLRAMRQLATFYNPTATNFIQDADSDEDTVATSNQLGREGADATDPDPDADDDDSDAPLKRHVLQEDGSDTSSKTHGLKEDGSVIDQASAAIDYLPDFARFPHAMKS